MQDQFIKMGGIHIYLGEYLYLSISIFLLSKDVQSVIREEQKRGGEIEREKIYQREKEKKEISVFICAYLRVCM